MGQVKDASGAPGRAMPLSPHLQVWRWHITMAASIFTRATGVALYVGLFVVVAWAVSLASGPDAYAVFMGLMASWLGKLVLFGLTVSIFYHLAAGLRHLAFDAGKGFEPKTANMTATLCMAFGVVATLVIWVVAYMMGSDLMSGASGYRTPLSRVRGLGSAKEGAHRFIGERATAIALVPLSLWAVYAVLQVAPVGYEGAVTLLQSPFNAVMACLLIAVSCAHMEMGMRVIVEDYIHDHTAKIACLLLNAGACWLGGALGVFSILKVALLGAGA